MRLLDVNFVRIPHGAAESRGDAPHFRLILVTKLKSVTKIEGDSDVGEIIIMLATFFVMLVIFS